MTNVIDERFLDYLKDDQLTEPNKRLLSKIKTFYKNIFLSSRVRRIPEHDMVYFTLIYNLLLLGYTIEPVLMLSLIEPNYYKDHLMRHAKDAASYLQQAEDIKNKIDKASKEKEIILRERGEFLLVLQGMVNFLMNQLVTFPGKDEFMLFVEDLRQNPIAIQTRPEIRLIKD